METNMQQLNQNGEILNQYIRPTKRFLGNRLSGVMFFFVLMFAGLLRLLGITITLDNVLSCSIFFFLILEIFSLKMPKYSTKNVIAGMLILSWSTSVLFFNSNTILNHYSLDSIINYFYTDFFVLGFMYLIIESQEPQINGGVVSSNILITALAAMTGGLNKLKGISLTQQEIACLAPAVYLFVNLGFILAHFLKTYSNTLEYSEKD